MATKTRRADKPAKRPELKIGPFQGGIGVAVWTNEVGMPCPTVLATSQR